jgi:acyl-CoA synthetase (AMP-forming)/AMP-acid ligase II
VFDERDLAPYGPVTREAWRGAPALSYPNRPESVLDILDWGVRRTPDSVLFVDTTGTEISYARFGGLVEATAAWLSDQGVRSGEAIAVASVNSTPLAALIFAAARLGAVTLNLPPRLDTETWAYMLTDAPCTFTVADVPRLAPLREAALAAGVQRPVELRAVPSGGIGWAYDPVTQAPAQDRTYAISYTAGRTGRPKAIQLAHRGSVHAAITFQRILQLQPLERTAVTVPLGHVNALHAHVLPAILTGGTCVLFDTAGPRRFLRLLATERISWACASPRLWGGIVGDAGFSADALTHLRMIGLTGAICPDPLADALHVGVPHVRLVGFYGTAETLGLATTLEDHQFAVRGGAAGRAVHCMEVAVRDQDGTDLPPGESGQVWLRGSLVTTGYASDPKASEEAIVDGWFATGDSGRLDEGGYLWLLDQGDSVNTASTRLASSAWGSSVARYGPAAAK